MAASLPSSSSSITRPPETSQPDVFTSSTISPSSNRAASHRTVNNIVEAQLSRPAKSTLGDRRAHPPPPLHITDKEPREQGSKTPTSATSAPSAPIPIPRRQKSSGPTTPLTARESKGGHFPFATQSPVTPGTSTESREYYQQHRVASASASAAAPASSQHRKNSSSVQPTKAQKSATKAPNMHDQPLPRYNPSAPFSPTMPLSPLQPMNQNPHLPRRAGKNLHLTSLPRFHPANYQSAESSHAAIHRGARSSVPQRQGSEASQQLHQYRRDLVDSATMSARSLLSPKLSKPSPPRLHPLGSPGPVTPLMLEGQDDYLMGGSATSPQPVTAIEGRELVDRLIREEHDRIKHPGIHSARHSPAVSPAAGRR